MTFHFRLKTSRPVRHPPPLLPIAIEAWLLWESLQIRIGNPYLTKDEAMGQAVASFAVQHPYIRGTLRRSDGSIVGQVGLRGSARTMQPVDA